MITPEQLRAAHGLLGWSKEKFADFLEISRVTLHALETKKTKISPEMSEKIERRLSRAGIILVGEAGIFRGDTTLKIFEGDNMFIDFYAQVYEALRISNPIIRVSGVDERTFYNQLGDDVDNCIEKLSTLQNLDVRALTIEELADYKAAHAKYKFIDPKYFLAVPLYMYQNKVAFILWDSRKIIQIEDEKLFTALALQFDYIWDHL